MSAGRSFVPGILLLPLLAAAELQVVVIEGLGGEAGYSEQFSQQVAAIERATRGTTNEDSITVFRSNEFSRQDVLGHFADLGNSMQPDDRLAVFLIGHGSYDDHEYKFNIAGPDLTSDDLSEMLDNTPGASQLLVNVSSSSGAVLDLLKRENRILVLATRSGVERHATRFGNYFAAALSDSGADIDKNGIVSAEEAFRFAEREVADYFERNGQLATEHPRIEGSQAGRFALARLGSREPIADDVQLRQLTVRRSALNAEIDALRLRRDAMTAEDYQSDLLQKMLSLAMLEDEIEQRVGELAQ